MIATRESTEVIRYLTRWAERRETVRAMLLTSTRANPHADTDILSDYDVVLVVRDIRPFCADRSWLQDFGQVLVAYWDAIEPDPDFGIDQTGNVMQYADGLKIDFRLWPIALMKAVAQAPSLPPGVDAGYTVLTDKDGLTRGMLAPTYRAYIPPRPTDEAFQTLVQDFFSDAPYVAKFLWRDELLPAKWFLDGVMKHTHLRRLLEWRMEVDHEWSVPAGNLGKGLKKALPPEIWTELESTYAGAGIDENWEALFRTIALFRHAAIDVADHLGYAYPHDLDAGVTAYVREIKALPRPQHDHESHEA
jgi:aminoglycoside 6-adenylyltransferase